LLILIYHLFDLHGIVNFQGVTEHANHPKTNGWFCSTVQICICFSC